jgi:carboxyl-terminal processing protease
MPHYKRNIQILQLIVLPILFFMLGWVFHNKYSHQVHSDTSSTERKTESSRSAIPVIKIPIKRNTDPRDIDLSQLWETWNVLEDNFLYQDKFEAKEQITGIIKGMVNSLDDPYTIYMSPKENKEFEDSISGEFEGIGAEIAVKDEHITVVTPLKGSPAEQAGLQPGDVIFKVDGDPTFGLSAFEAAMKIRGPKGEKVTLEVLRKDEPRPLEIIIVRDKIVVKSLEWKKLDNDIVYVEISQFGTDLVRLWRTAVPVILLEQPKGIVIDLRNNGGGLLDATVELSHHFLDNKPVVKTRGRKFGNKSQYVSKEGGSFADIPIIVLINQGSASASEIFAGAVQDNERGVIIGEKSFGKGSVQNIIPLTGGASLKVTIAEWLTPDGNSIHETGITPDIEAIRTKEEFNDDVDPVLDKALEVIFDEAAYTKAIEQENNIEEVADINDEESLEILDDAESAQ